MNTPCVKKRREERNDSHFWREIFNNEVWRETRGKFRREAGDDSFGGKAKVLELQHMQQG